MKTIDYKAYFHAAYQGAADFNANILEPLFGSNLMPNDSNEYVREEDQSFIQNIHRCGEYVLNGDPIEFFDVTLTENCQISRNRLNIKKTVVRLMEAYSGAFIVFHYSPTSTKTTWRFSWVEKIRGNSDTSAPKRYTYLCGSKYSCRTIGDRIDKLLKAKNDNTLTVNSITNAFDVEALSEDFFKEYKVFYEDIVQYICGNRYVPKKGKPKEFELKQIESAEVIEKRGIYKQFKDVFGCDVDKAVRDYVKKLLGRLVFIQFLQKKGWLGIPSSKKDWEGGDTDFLSNTFSNAPSDSKDNFVENVLEDILFESFNKPNSIRNGIKYPYLNGGLFERDKADELKVKLPRAIFVSEKDDERKYYGKPAPGKEYDYTRAEGLFQFFDRYNFTIDENDPDDAIVGVDPEMLGKIFENLLEDNKDKGAFYTPKEIVQYMCREAIITYLTTCAVKNTEGKYPQKQTEDSVRKLVQTPEKIVPYMTERQLTDFRKALQDVRVCDPAVGSGAFPMGLLNELLRLRIAIGAWSEKKYDTAALKKEIIQNCIYGVDIEQGAIDIARLRFWLSIMVDLDQPEPLPNFDYKFMQGNSLITTFGGAYINLDTKEQKHTNVNLMIKKKEELYNAKKKYYTASGEEKLKLAIKIKDLILQLISLQLDYEVRSEIARVDTQKDIFADTEEKLDTRPIKDIIQDLSPERQKIIEIGKQLRCVLADVSRSLEERAQTDIRFFDWRMMFTEIFDTDNPGFDIVIGNPPYIRRTSLPASDKLVYEKIYKSTTGQYDLYLLFQELALQCLKHSGAYTFINPLRYFNADYGLGCRTILATQNKIKYILDVSQLPVFLTAMTYPCITCVERTICDKEHNIEYTRLEDLKLISVVNQQPHIYVNQYKIASDPLHRFLIGSIDQFLANNKIEKNTIKLSSKFKIARGLANSLVDFNTHQYPALKSTSVKRFKIDDTIYVDTDDTHRDLFRLPMIILPRTVKSLIATIKPENTICLDRIYFLSPKESIDATAILGIINSQLMNYWFELNYFSTKVRGNYFDLNGDQIGAMPLPSHPNETRLVQIRELVNNVILLGGNSPDLERKIDILVYHLYELTYDEVKIIDPNITNPENENYLSEEDYNKM